MKAVFQILLVLVLLLSGKRDHNFKNTSFSLQVNKVLDKEPEFYVLEWKDGTSLTPEKTDLSIEVDSMGRQGINVLMDQRKEPVLYTADISTPVCADGECKLMNIKLYWTLLGEYAGFDRYPNLPMTKYDHDEFAKEDYQKLHVLLRDDKSILGRRSIDRLVEKPKMRKVNGVDAISGATIAQVKESVVSGALYSCYTAWHLVHGVIRKKLKAHTLPILSENMLTGMLYSINPEYHVFALQNIDQLKYAEHYLQIAEVFRSSTPLVRSILAKGLLQNYGDTPDLQWPFWEAFDQIDLGSRSLLLHHLGKAPRFVIDILSKKLGAMSKNQLKVYLNHVSISKESSNEVQKNLTDFANSEVEIYAYLVKEFIEENQ